MGLLRGPRLKNRKMPKKEKSGSSGRMVEKPDTPAAQEIRTRTSLHRAGIQGYFTVTVMAPAVLFLSITVTVVLPAFTPLTVTLASFTLTVAILLSFTVAV